MRSNDETPLDDVSDDTDLLLTLLKRSDRVFIKKLSNNDRDWARFENKHQGGAYIPQEQRDGGFFPPLTPKARPEPAAAEIREAFFPIVWPQIDEEQKTARLVHYTSKGQETHLTGLPKILFQDLLPASYLVVGRVATDHGATYHAVTLSSGSEEAIFLIDLFEIDLDFVVGEFDPASMIEAERSRTLSFAEQVIAAWLSGEIQTFAVANATMPSTLQLAAQARASFLKGREIDSLNPFKLEKPGDALREISRSIEWELFRDYQRRERAVALVRIIMGDRPATWSCSDIIRRLIDEFHQIDGLMLSASQQRKSRAGTSYEHHIESMLRDGAVPYEKQVVIEARKRPDFVLPSWEFLNRIPPEFPNGLILSAKTTLRERWKQVEREKGGRELFLTTVDENIASNAIEDMASLGVQLVVPESLKDSKETEYKGHKNVMSFRDFCDEIVAPRIGKWVI